MSFRRAGVLLIWVALLVAGCGGEAPKGSAIVGSWGGGGNDQPATVTFTENGHMVMSYRQGGFLIVMRYTYSVTNDELTVKPVGNWVIGGANEVLQPKADLPSETRYKVKLTATELHLSSPPNTMVNSNLALKKLF